LREYVRAEFAEALLEEQPGATIDRYGYVTLPNKVKFSVEASTYFSGFRKHLLVPIINVVGSKKGSRITNDAWLNTMHDLVERAVDKTGIPAHMTLLKKKGFSNRYTQENYGYVPSWLPKKTEIVKGLVSTSFFAEDVGGAAAAERIFAEHRFRVPKEYRKQIGALVLSAFENNDAASYVQAKHLAALVAE
jgi:hypothetical protein